jgi:hypothetical protein
MLKKEIRKKLLEIKENNVNLMIEEKIIFSRLKLIAEGEYNSRNFKFLPRHKQVSIFGETIVELRKINEEGLISEDFNLWGMLKGLFGSGVETLAEPIINKILTSLGFTSNGFFKKFMISYLTSRPGDLIKAFVDCKTLTRLIAESLIEATLMNFQEQKEFGGFGFDMLRNTLGDSLKSTEVISSLEEKLSGKVCELFDMFGGKAKSISDTIKNNGSKIPFIGSQPGGIAMS